MIAPTSTGAVRCAIYTRVSTADQARGEFSSIDNQRETAQLTVQARATDGWELVPTTYDDEGFSGGSLERPALQRLLRDIEARQIDCVVVYKLDRLSRKLRELLWLLDYLKERQVGFVSVSESFDTSGAMGNAMLGMIGVFAELERGMISERTRDKMVAARKRGRYTGGPPPLGYNVHPDGGKLIPSQDEAERVRSIYELYLERGTMSETLAVLRERGWKTKTWETKRGHLRQGKLFQKGSLDRLLRNPIYIGRVKYGDATYEGEHDPILDFKLWDRVQRKLSSNASNGGSGTKDKYGYLLKGLLRCSACDTAMSPSTTKRPTKSYRYYVCTGAQRNGWQSCPTKSIPAEEIERVIVERIRAIGQDEELVAETVRAAEEQRESDLKRIKADIKVVGRELRQLKAQEEKLLSVVTEGGTPAHRAAEKLDELTRDAEVIQEQGRKLESQTTSLEAQRIDPNNLANALADFDGIWEVLLPQERRRVTQLLIQQVDYHGGTEELGITFQPSGIRSLIAEAVDPEEVPA